MPRNELIIALSRVLGIYLVAQGIFKLFDFADYAIGRTYDFVMAMYDFGFKVAWAGYPLGRIIASLLGALLVLFIGMYLLKANNWFAKKATQE